jgi:hypothetical protein
MNNQPIAGIQWLRAAMSIFVVVWHLGGVDRSLIFAPNDFNRHVFSISDFLNFHVLLVAVPAFVIISNYLLAIAPDDARTLFHRAKRIVILLLFWPMAINIYSKGWQGFANSIPTSAPGLLTYVLTAGQTIYFFFCSLLITLGVTFVAKHASLAANIWMLLLSSAALSVAPFIAIHYASPYLCAYWSPLNFVPYTFGAIVVARYFNSNFNVAGVTLGVLGLFCLSCLLSYFEWRFYPDAIFFKAHGYALPAYSRSSLVFGSMMILIIALHIKLQVPAIIDFMARNSLALYCLHLFLAGPVILAMATYGLETTSLASRWVIISFTVMASYLAARLLSFVWKDRLLV